MNKNKLLTVVITATLVCGGFFAGKTFASTTEPGSSGDPVVTASYVDAKVKELTTKINELEKKLNNLSSNSGGTSSGSTSGGSSDSGSADNSTTSLGTATVTVAALNVRSGAGTSYSVAGKLYEGNKVTLLKKSGSWYQIKSGSVTGWVSGEYLKISGASSNSSTTTAKTGVVNVATLNVRSGAGTSYSIVGKLKSGNKVTITKKSGSWYKIKFGSITGWVSGDCLDV